MGIRFLCPACTKRINVKEHQAGKRGFCPKCGAAVQIPLASTLTDRQEQDEDSAIRGGVPPAAAQASAGAAAPVGRMVAVSGAPAVDPLAENPTAVWYVSGADGGQPFGPADGATMFQWLQEGRIAGTSLVWRQDWPEWQPAARIWPHLAAGAQGASAPQPPPPALHAAPVAGALSTHGGAATNATLSAPVGRSPVGSSPPAAAIYYQRRSNGVYLTTVVVLVLLVAALAWLTYFVISRGPIPADEKTSSRPTETQSV
ncbi:MAG: hypothetical protein C0483_16130 [Pirellula sp.]|nr:hypothetical protein [Pirellula sp.]